MPREKRKCPYCQTPQTVKDDPSANSEALAYGTNNAGLKFVKHKFEGKICKGSGYVLE